MALSSINKEPVLHSKFVLNIFPTFAPMKFFCLLFAFYTLSISVMPCNDVHDGAKKAVTTFTEAQDHHENHNDICSPFCICSCCQGFVALTPFHPVTISETILVSNFSHYSKKFISSAFASIWKPPKLG